MDMLLADRELARKNGQSSAAIRATELIGVELGMFVTRTDNKHSHERRVSELPAEERRAYIADLLSRAREAIERQRLIEAEAQEVQSRRHSFGQQGGSQQGRSYPLTPFHGQAEDRRGCRPRLVSSRSTFASVYRVGSNTTEIRTGLDLSTAGLGAARSISDE
jgi:hypothetical protein